jgi:hypothetical protein
MHKLMLRNPPRRMKCFLSEVGACLLGGRGGGGDISLLSPTWLASLAPYSLPLT